MNGERWTLDRWRDLTNSHYPILRLGEALPAMDDDALTGKVAEIPAASMELAENVAAVVAWAGGHGTPGTPAE